MLVFLSWSGSKSKAIAEALERWLVQVIQAVEPWISSDIEKGLRWGPEIGDKLEKSKVGIICLTRDNLDSKWIHFESGALSKTKDAYVCTLLLGITPVDVEPPLAQFQHTLAQKEEMYQLLLTINNAVNKVEERALAEPILRDIFETYWPRLEKQIEEILSLPDAVSQPSRSTGDILQEVLELLRNQERRQTRLEEIMRIRMDERELIQHKDAYERGKLSEQLLLERLKDIFRKHEVGEIKIERSQTPAA